MKLEDYIELGAGDFVKYSGYNHWGVVTKIPDDREWIRVVVLCEMKIYMKDLKTYQVLEYWEPVLHLDADSKERAAYEYLLGICLSVAHVFSSRDTHNIIRDHNEATK